ncbi:MAG: FecCD family ABC transporter permease [Gemmatimonadales bacterium]
MSTQSVTMLADYRRLLRRRAVMLGGLFVALAASLLFDLVTGPSGIPVAAAIRGLLDPAGSTGPEGVIVWGVRLPYALMALLVGGALSLAGAEMQTTLNNPLASPFTLGMSSAAIFGAALAIVLDLGIPGIPGDWIVSVNAFVFAFASVLALQAVARSRAAGVETLVLFGIALFFTFNALVAITQFVASEQALQQLVFWTMGSLGRSTWPKIQVLAIVIAVVAPFSLAASWRLTALRLGEERARSFGVDVGRLRFASLFRISVLTATAVAFVGTVAFVGLVGPHIARMLVGEDHRFFLPASALTGALVLSLASIASKTIIPGVLIPIGLVSALIGVPFFVYLIFSKRTVA